MASRPCPFLVLLHLQAEQLQWRLLLWIWHYYSLILYQSGHPEQDAQGHGQVAAGEPQGEGPTASVQPMQHSAEVLPVFRGSLYIPVCAHGLLTWHRVSLKGAWLCPLCTVLPEAYRHKSVQIDTFINHLSWGRRRESEEEDSVSVAILKVHAPLLLSACSKIRLSTELWRPHLACGGTVHPTACEAPKGDQIKVTSDGSLLQDYTSDQCFSVTLLHTHFKDISKLTQLAPSAWRSLAKQTSSYCLKWVPDSWLWQQNSSHNLKV